MKGLELSEKFYYEYGEKMIKENFAGIEKYLAFGLVGSGSECFGYDDEISQDHDFEPGFCIFIPDESIIDSRTEFQLERAYAKLPKEFMGYKRSPLNPVGGNRHGVIRIEKFFEAKTGDANADIPTVGWFCISEQFPLEATNGKIFCDNFGLMTRLREKIAYMPEDVRLKKLAGNILIMAQSGQYNYARCIKRGETAAAQLAVTEFVNTTLKVIFLLNKKYMPLGAVGGYGGYLRAGEVQHPRQLRMLALASFVHGCPGFGFYQGLHYDGEHLLAFMKARDEIAAVENFAWGVRKGSFSVVSDNAKCVFASVRSEDENKEAVAIFNYDAAKSVTVNLMPPKGELYEAVNPVDGSVIATKVDSSVGVSVSVHPEDVRFVLFARK